MNILLQGLFYFAAGIDIVQVGIKQNFEHHTGMVAAGTSSFICPEQTTNIQGVYNTVYNTNGMIGSYLSDKLTGKSTFWLDVNSLNTILAIAIMFVFCNGKIILFTEINNSKRGYPTFWTAPFCGAGYPFLIIKYTWVRTEDY